MIRMILICDDDSTVQVTMKRAFKGRYECRSAYHGDEAISILRANPVTVVILDIQMRTPTEGLELIPKLLELDPDLAIIMSSSRTDPKSVRDAIQLGAIDYLSKDADPEELVHAVESALTKRSLLVRRNQQDFETLSGHREKVLIGETPPMLQLKKAIEKIRGSSMNILITGETGTGKEVVARLLRRSLPQGSARSSLEPFVAIDSSTIQSSTAESQLFGHEKGAFTGAERTTKGIFEEANGGTVYFDEVANMPLTIQAKLLRVIQEKEVTRLGAAKSLQLDFRVICATNRDLELMSQAGEFKPDLFQRLNVIPISIPPLRERTADIPLLLDHFAKKNAPDLTPVVFRPETVELLQAYPWPGNVRELANLVAYLHTMTDTAEIEIADLPPKIRDRAEQSLRRLPSQTPTPPNESGTFYERVARFERDILTQEYQHYQGNISKIALNLGIDRSHLYTKLKEHGIHAAKK